MQEFSLWGKIDNHKSNSKVVSTTIYDRPSIINIKLDGTNHFVWLKILEMHITNLEKRVTLTEEKVAPTKDDLLMVNEKLKMLYSNLGFINSLTDIIISHFVQYGMTK